MSQCVPLIFVVSILIVVGMVLISSVDVASQLVLFGNTYRNIFSEHVQRLVVGVILMVVTVIVDYSTHERLAVFYYFLALGLLVMPFFYPAIGGSHRWVTLGFFNFQPSEFAKIAIIIFVSSYISQNKSRMGEFFKGFVLPILLISPMLALILFEPDLSTALILFALTLLLLYSHGTRGIYIALTLGLSFLIIFVFAKMKVFLSDYQLWRLRTFFEGQIPEQVAKSLQAIREGRITGKGIGLGTVKLTVPAVVTDFILSVLGEEFGILGIIAVIALFVILVGILLKSVERISDTFASSYIVGFSFLIMLQVLVNLGVVAGVLPVTGIALPLISYGGSSMVTILGAFGIVINILTNQPNGSETI